MSKNPFARKSLLILSYSILISVALQSTAASNSVDQLQEPLNNGDNYIKVNKVLRPWDPYTDFIQQDLSIEETSAEKRGSKFYHLRGKKMNSSLKEKLDQLSSLYGKDIDQKRAMAFVPVRGRKASNFIPTRGRKASAFNAMRGKKDEEPSDDGHHTSYWKDHLDGESIVTSSPGGTGKLRDVGLTLTEDYDKDEDHPFLDEAEKRAASRFFGSRGKRRAFPYVTWRVFQGLRAAPASQGAKREALFFASRGRRSSEEGNSNP